MSDLQLHSVLMQRLLLVVVLVNVVGCGGGPTMHQVDGVVTFAGKAVPEGWVFFVSAQNERTTAEIGADGGYSAQLSAGEYKVGVSAPRAHNEAVDPAQTFFEKALPPHVPPSYADPLATGIVLVVKEGVENDFDLKLGNSRKARR